MIIAPAIKTKDNEVFISRNCHVEILIMYPEKFEYAEQGFITSDLKFVDRVEGLEIAKRYNQIKTKYGLESELYSEDLFL